MDKKIKVVVNSAYVDEGNNIRIKCYMEDKSIWTCSKDGDDWKEELPNADFYTEKFNGRKVV